MVKSYKSLKKLAFITSILLVALFIHSCRKDHFSHGGLSDGERIAKAKAWYNAEQKDKKLELVSSKGKKVELIFKPQWDKAVVEDVDGNTIIAMGIETNLKSITGQNTTYDLIITSIGEKFEAKTITTNTFGDEKSKLSIKELYRTAFTPANLANERKLFADIKVFNGDFSEDKHTVYTVDKMRHVDTQKNAPELDLNLMKTSNQIKTSVEIVTVCIDWWLLIQDFDVNGHIVALSSTYLGRTCEDLVRETDHIAPEEPAGGGGPTSDTLKIDFGRSIDGPLTITTTVDESEDDAKYETRWYTWPFHEADHQMVRFEAYSKGRLKKLPGEGEEWKFISYAFLSAYPHGGSLTQTFDVVVLDSEAEYADYMARLKLFYKIHSSVVGLGTTVTAYSRAYVKEKETNSSER